MMVVDASTVIRLLANRGIDDMLRRRMSAPRTLHAPHLIDAEVGSGIRGLLLGRKVDRERAGEMVADFASLRITRHPMLPYLSRVIDLRDNLSAYDAAYVALAETLAIPLLTTDAKLAGATGHTADVQVYP